MVKALFWHLSSNKINEDRLFNQLYLFRTQYLVNMTSNKELDQQFVQNLEFHSTATLFDSSQTLPLYKLAIKPYDYYIKYGFQGNLQRVQFYQQLQAISNLIISPQRFTIEQIQVSYFSKLFGLSQQNKFSISCYFRYYNYTIQSWINQQKQCNSVISQQEILMVFSQLLSFQNSYYQQYKQCCGIFKAQFIYITPQKRLRIYPHSIKYNGQIAVHREKQLYLLQSNAKLDKQCSIETTLTNSQIQYEPTNYIQNIEIDLNEDVRDIFILILEMLSFKKYDHFWNRKHCKVVWDSVKSILNSTYVSHLSEPFLNVLKQCADNKIFQSHYLLQEINKIIEGKTKVCKTIHVQKNEELATFIQKASQERKEKKLQGLTFLHKNQYQKGLTKCNSL